MNGTMKEMPASIRPYEKCVQYGAEALSDVELLAVLLRSGTKNKNVLALSSDILEAAGMSIAGMYRLSGLDFIKIPGVGRIKSIQLECMMEFAKRLLNSVRPERPLFQSPSMIASYLMEEMRLKKEEELRALFLDGKSAFLHEEMISKGAVNGTMMPTREIFVKALQYSAVYFVLVHNHPSGDPTPSEEDIHATKTMCEAGKIVGIPLLDHIIIGDHRYVSLKDRGLIQ